MNITVGRALENLFVISDDAVSARHAVIEIVDGFQTLVDLGSSNGTYVNGLRISRHILAAGDQVKFGESTFVWNGVELRERGGIESGFASPVYPREGSRRGVDGEFFRKRSLVFVSLGIGLVFLTTIIFFAGKGGDKKISADELAKRTVYIEMNDSDDETCWSGSGAVVLDGTFVLTNEHVAMPDETDQDLADCTFLRIGIVDKSSNKPTKFFGASVLESSKSYDLALLKVDLKGSSALTPFKVRDDELGLDVPIRVIGFPGVGGGTVTLTNGVISGIDDSDSADFYKTSATINHGNSGGPVVDVDGNLVAIATAFNPVGIACTKTDCVTDGIALGLARPIRYALSFLKDHSKN